MNTPPAPPPNAPKRTSVFSKLKPTVSFGVQGRKDKNLVILTLSMFAVGIFLVIYGVYEIKGSQESRNWPSAQGTIVYSGVHDFTTRDSNHRTKTSYSPKISYRYRVGRREYTSERFHFGVGESGGSRESAQKVIAGYPSGKKVQVYYNPEDPRYGVLYVGFRWSSLLTVFGGLIFFAVGVFCLKAYLKNRPKT